MFQCQRCDSSLGDARIRAVSHSQQLLSFQIQNNVYTGLLHRMMTRKRSACHWQAPVTGYEQALPSSTPCPAALPSTTICPADVPCTSICPAEPGSLGLPVIMTGGAPPTPTGRGQLGRSTHQVCGQKGGASHSPCWMNSGQVSVGFQH